MYGATRAFATLIGVAAAGALLWLATQVLDIQFGFSGTSGEYWAFVGLAAAAGLVLALSQLLGGWTKWGRPRVSIPVLLLGFLPALIAGGLVLLATAPGGGWTTERATDIVGEVGAATAVDDLGALFPVIAFGIGLVFGLVFDTSVSPRFAPAEPDARAADEAVTAERVEAEADREPMRRDEAAADRRRDPAVRDRR